MATIRCFAILGESIQNQHESVIADARLVSPIALSRCLFSNSAVVRRLSLLSHFFKTCSATPLYSSSTSVSLYLVFFMTLEAKSSSYEAPLLCFSLLTSSSRPTSSSAKYLSLPNPSTVFRLAILSCVARSSAVIAFPPAPICFPDASNSCNTTISSLTRGTTSLSGKIPRFFAALISARTAACAAVSPRMEHFIAFASNLFSSLSVIRFESSSSSSSSFFPL
mmetsp:Transcript_71198/g.167832  ORF Transcript_71198/g.167832 Transcript_71198/m.167832 type:complete len:223 (-) Transcript_71198:227-895(-)